MYSLVASQYKKRSGRTLSTVVILKIYSEPDDKFDNGETGRFEWLYFMTEDRDMKEEDPGGGTSGFLWPETWD